MNLRTSTFTSHVVPVLPLLIDDSRDLVHTELNAVFLDDLSTSIGKRTSDWLDGMDSLDVRQGDGKFWKEGSCYYTI